MRHAVSALFLALLVALSGGWSSTAAPLKVQAHASPAASAPRLGGRAVPAPTSTTLSAAWLPRASRGYDALSWQPNRQLPVTTDFLAAKAGTAVAEEVVERQVTVLGRYKGGTENFIGEPGFNVLNNPAKGTGRWNWTRNKRFIDDAIERGDEIRLVTNPHAPQYSGGNVYQRELRYLSDKGYTFVKSGEYWRATPGR